MARSLVLVHGYFSTVVTNSNKMITNANRKCVIVWCLLFADVSIFIVIHVVNLTFRTTKGTRPNLKKIKYSFDKYTC